MSPHSGSLDSHLTVDEVAGYLDGAAPAAERSLIEAHLADCPACREEVVAVAEASRRSRSLPPSRVRWTIAGTAAAAAAAVALLLVPPVFDDPPRTPLLRDPGGANLAGAVAAIEVVAPENTGTLSAGAVAFVWRAAAPDAQYRLTLTTPDGDPVWTTTTADTAAAPPSGVSLEADTEYFWWVDALLSDGASATTGVHGFRTPR